MTRSSAPRLSHAQAGRPSAVAASRFRESHKPRDELAELLFGFRVGELAIRVEGALGARHHHAALGPELRAQGAEDRQPRVLAEDGAEIARRGSYERDRLSAENPLDVGRWPRQPVDGVLENARDRIVVFGRDEKQAVGRRNRVFQRRDRVGNSIGGLPVSIVERDIADRADCQVRTRGINATAARSNAELNEP